MEWLMKDKYNYITSSLAFGIQPRGGTYNYFDYIKTILEGWLRNKGS